MPEKSRRSGDDLVFLCKESFENGYREHILVGHFVVVILDTADNIRITISATYSGHLLKSEPRSRWHVRMAK